jgi:NADH dehydrogenase
MTHPGATPSDKHKVVIIGSGFGGLTAAKKLKRADVDIKLIAKTTHHLFQPLLYQVATGIISEGEIAPLTRVVLRNNKNCQVLLGEVTHIDLKNKTVDSLLLGHTYRTPYDTLIVAAGAGQSYFGNDHFAEWAPGMKTIDDALELRGRILGAFEQAERSSDPVRREKLLTFVVVGAGPTGVEMAGPDRRTRRSHPQGRVPSHRLHEGPGDPARRRSRRAAADGREAGPEGRGPAGEARRGDPARGDGHRRRPQRHHRQAR